MAYGQDDVSVNLENPWIEHDVIIQNQKGMYIHCELEISNMKGKTAQVLVGFFKDDETPLRAIGVSNKYRTTDSQLCTGGYAYCRYESTYWEDYKLFIPYNVIGSCVNGNYAALKCLIGVSTKSGEVLAISESLTFEISR